MSSEDECSILDAASGALHKSLDHDGYTYLPTDDPLGRPFMRSFSTRRAAFDPTGTRLALASDITSEIIDIETGNTLLVLDRDSAGRKRNTRTISISLDGRLVLEVDYDTCYIWDAFTGTKLSQLKGHGHDILGARFSSCRKYIASTSYDKKIRLWRTSDGSCLTTLSDHEDQVTHVAFSPDGKTLSSADSGGRVIIRRMRDMTPPIDTQDGPALIAPSPLPVIHLSPHPSPLSDGHVGISPDEETDPEKLRFTPGREEVGEPEERRIEEDAASSARLGPPQPTAGASVQRDEEDEESAVRDSLIAGHQCTGSAARSSLSDSMATTPRPIAVDGDDSTGSARLSSATVVEREAPRVRVQPPACEAREDVDSAAPPQAPTTAGQENKNRVEGNTTDSGRLVLRQPIAGASTQQDDGGDESVDGNSLTADGANLDAPASPEVCEAAVEDLPTHAVLTSLPTSTGHEAPTNQGRPPTRAAQVDANGAGLVQATPAVGQVNATCSDGAMAGDGLADGQRAVSAAHSSLSDSMATTSESIAVDGDGSTSSARLSSQPPSREASEDANALAQAQAAPSVEQKDPESSAVSPHRVADRPCRQRTRTEARKRRG